MSLGYAFGFGCMGSRPVCTKPRPYSLHCTHMQIHSDAHSKHMHKNLTRKRTIGDFGFRYIKTAAATAPVHLCNEMELTQRQRRKRKKNSINNERHFTTYARCTYYSTILLALRRIALRLYTHMMITIHMLAARWAVVAYSSCVLLWDRHCM